MQASLLPGLALALALPLAAQAGVDADLAKQLDRATYSLAEAIQKGMKTAGQGQPYSAELELDKGTLVYSIDIAAGKKTVNVVLDAVDAKVIENDTEDEDESERAGACKVTLAAAIAAAVKKGGGQPIAAAMRLLDGKPFIDVKLFDKKAGSATSVCIDGLTAAVVQEPAAARGAPQGEEKKWTDVFHTAPEDMTSTGQSLFWILEPGRKMTYQGKEGGKNHDLVITVLKETKKVDGVETRIVEERESVDGQLIEVSRNYFAISKKTNDVYYFGEDVDMYKDGKVVSHEGAWLSGEKGAHFGLFLPGTPLLGARFYQEVAPGQAMDRAEIVSLNETVETPSGKYDKVMKYEETTPLEKGAKEYKWFAPGVGLIQDADLKLVKIEK
jgi:hypothetical protein